MASTGRKNSTFCKDGSTASILSVMKVFIVGLPGSGKSTLGNQLADQLNVAFLDLDEVIEHKAGQPIREIFAQHGEDAFRKLEQCALQEVIKQYDAFVVATGGGAPCFYDNLAVMNQGGITLFLDVPVSVIIQRMKGNQITDRPLLHNLDQDRLVQEYTAKFKKRLPIYRQAHIIIHQDTSVQEVVDQLKVRN